MRWTKLDSRSKNVIVIVLVMSDKNVCTALVFEELIGNIH